MGLRTERVGALPLVGHVLARIGMDALLERFVPSDRRCDVPHAKALSAFLRSLVVEREPVYRQHEAVAAFAPELFGLDQGELDALGDDRIGRALDHLFDADRGAFLTEVLVEAGLSLIAEAEIRTLDTDSASLKATGPGFAWVIPNRE